MTCFNFPIQPYVLLNKFKFFETLLNLVKLELVDEEKQNDIRIAMYQLYKPNSIQNSKSARPADIRWIF